MKARSRIQSFNYSFRTESSAENSTVSPDTSCASEPLQQLDKKLKPSVPPKPPPKPTTVALSPSSSGFTAGVSTAGKLLHVPREIQRSQSQPADQTHQHRPLGVLRHANSQDSPVPPGTQYPRRPPSLKFIHSHSLQEPERISRFPYSKNAPLHQPAAGSFASPDGSAANRSILSTPNRLRPSCRTTRMQQLHISLDQLSLQHQQVCFLVMNLNFLATSDKSCMLQSGPDGIKFRFTLWNFSFNVEDLPYASKMYAKTIN